MSAGTPKVCTTRMARVRRVMACSTAFGSRLSVTGSISAKTGVARTCRTAFDTAMKAKEGMMTSSPAPMLRVSRARWRPAVPELTATAWGTA